MNFDKELHIIHYIKCILYYFHNNRNQPPCFWFFNLVYRFRSLLLCVYQKIRIFSLNSIHHSENTHTHTHTRNDAKTFQIFLFVQALLSYRVIVTRRILSNVTIDYLSLHDYNFPTFFNHGVNIMTTTILCGAWFRSLSQD